MNKKLLSIAVAASIVAPMVASADATLYGRIRNSLVYYDVQDNLDNPALSDPDEEWDVESQSSRLGVKGSEDLGSGLKAIYQIELEMNTSEGGGTSRPPDTFGTRLGYAGLSGDWGTLAIGRQWTPYYGTVDKYDVYDVGNFNDTYIGLTRIGDTIAYISPNFSGFSGKLALIISDDGNDVDEEFADLWNVSLDYDNGPLSAGISYLGVEGDDVNDGDWDQFGIAASWKFGDMFKLIGSYESRDGNGLLGNTFEEDVDAYTIMGEVYFGNNTIRASFGSVDDDAKDDEEDQWTLGFKHNFSKRTSVHVEYEDSDFDQNFKGATYDEHARFGVGLRHDF